MLCINSRWCVHCVTMQKEFFYFIFKYYKSSFFKLPILLLSENAIFLLFVMILPIPTPWLTIHVSVSLLCVYVCVQNCICACLLCVYVGV